MERQEPVSKPEFENSGIGDTTIWGRYQIMSQKKKDPVFWWVGAGLNIPTGKTDVRQMAKQIR